MFKTRPIRQGYWPFAPNSLLQPSNRTIPLKVVDPSVLNCFLKCFNAGHKNSSVRPTARDWVEALEVASNKLRSCDKIASHHYSLDYKRCYWCERVNLLGIDILDMPTKDKQPTLKNSSQEPIQTPYKGTGNSGSIKTNKPLTSLGITNSKSSQVTQSSNSSVIFTKLEKWSAEQIALKAAVITGITIGAICGFLANVYLINIINAIVSTGIGAGIGAMSGLYVGMNTNLKSNLRPELLSSRIRGAIVSIVVWAIPGIIFGAISGAWFGVILGGLGSAVGNAIFGGLENLIGNIMIFFGLVFSGIIGAVAFAGIGGFVVGEIGVCLGIILGIALGIMLTGNHLIPALSSISNAWIGGKIGVLLGLLLLSIYRSVAGALPESE